MFPADPRGVGAPGADRTMRLRAVAPQGVRTGAGRPKPRWRAVPLLAAAGAVVAAGAVALALGLFTGSGKDGTTLADPKPSVPATGEAPAGPSQTPSGPAESASESASPSASASASRSASPSPSPSRTSAAPSPSPSASPPRATTPAPPPPPPSKAATLRNGDSGPEVLKLQRLLADQGMYNGRFDGRYGRSVERAVEDFQMEFGVYGDPWGVYGPATRRALEG
ncbi:peptidoglycan-binding protein [Streptomyces sp. NPDC001594]|uniref:peptidoglycan-binding domain-containing protein n=1 Tax=Streptomyces sp. NPDC001594 TaxID=3364590 RepID=UPI003699A6F6